VLPQYSHRLVSEGTQREDAATAILGLASWESQDQGLVNRQIAAGATNQFVHGIRVYKLETVAKRTLLTNHRMNRHGATWQREVQLHVLT
jgi:hypothetical protein